MKFGSLFAGIGGFDLGLERAGMECAWQVEIDEYCTKVLTKHWPNVPKYGDIRDVGKDLETVDLICGGFPCQPFSVAGKRKGTADDRHLWPEMLRVISELKPTWVLGENVPGIINIFLDQALSDLEAEGYSTEAYVLPACAFDAPHRRDRLFIVANLNDVRHLHRGSQKQPTNPRQYAQRDSSTGGADVADTQRKSASEPRRTRTGRAELGYRSIQREGGSSHNWLPEPGVGRVASRLSTALDGTLRRYGYEHASNQEAFTEIDFFRGEILRNMWHEHNEVEPPPYSPTRRGRDDSVYEVSCLRTHERWNLGKRIEKEEELRDLRDRIYAKPLKETQQLQQSLLERIRAQERNEKMASQRVNRLRGLGNAVVPQVVEFIGKQILEVSEQL